ncbi:MAG: hypothetical protein WBX14_14730 [Candidatus Udaeobacter sp.]|jgi:hypothetical protein
MLDDTSQAFFLRSRSLLHLSTTSTRAEINVYVSDKDIEVTGKPIQTAIIPILKIQ